MFHPMTDAMVRSRDSEEPRRPSCGIDAATESMPYRDVTGSSARTMSRMPTRLPATIVIAPLSAGR